jgi:hypothetical protein
MLNRLSEYDLKRWMRPDAHNFVRPDWRRFVAPGSDAASVFEIYEQKYREDQLRDDHGRWTDEGGGQDQSPISETEPAGDTGRISNQVASECEEMHRRDLFICKAFQSPACYTQAYLRYTNCQLGRPIPPLNF